MYDLSEIQSLLREADEHWHNEVIFDCSEGLYAVRSSRFHRNKAKNITKALTDVGIQVDLITYT